MKIHKHGKQVFRTLGIGLVLATLVGMMAAPGKADTTYTYTGNDFTFLLGTTCPPECNLTGSFTLLTPLADNLVSASFAPESFSFTDGLMTITNLNATFFTFDHVSTNAQGAITAWNMEWSTSGYSIFSGTDPAGCTGCSVIDVTFNTGVTIEAAIDAAPGIWSMSTTAAPEPLSVLLIGAGGLFIAGISRKRVFGRV